MHRRRICVCMHVTMKTGIITALMYDATFAWAHAANKTLEQGIYPTSEDMTEFGRTVARHLNNLDFDGKLLLVEH